MLSDLDVFSDLDEDDEDDDDTDGDYSNVPNSKASQILKYVEQHPGSTSTQIGHALNMSSSHVSGYLYRQCDLGNLIRFSGKGPRGGCGYYILPVNIKRQIQGLPPLPDTSEPRKNIWKRLAEDD